ncbi:MAG TPA: hypothetical protein VFJ58_17510 [Armatimonadota bacterium]|nr:hypothetical protein [Armatimonadota bacterium]
MAITIHLPPAIEDALLAEIEHRGITVEEYLLENTCLVANFCVQRTPPYHTSIQDDKKEPQPAAPSR